MEKLPEHISPEKILAYLKNQISESDFAIVQSWINASEENLRYFEQYKMIWEETGKLIPAPVDVNVDDAWDKMSFMIDEFEETESTKTEKNVKVIPIRKYLLRIAAIVLPLITISGLYLFLNQKPQLVTKETTAQLLKDTLSDGSVISLSKNSKISYPEKFKGNIREVEMKGEVFFEVSPNKEKPFIIHAEKTFIKVLGTSFNVKAFTDSILVEVSVKTGRVLFSEFNNDLNDTTGLILVAGETGIYNKNTGHIFKVELPVKQELQQEDKILIFKRSSLADVANEIKKKYGVTVVLQNKDIENMHYSATFKNSSIDSIIQVMANTLDLKVIKQGTKFIIAENE
jgi:ferric-dicitrate binding protein FerR (iron transport regulator)